MGGYKASINNLIIASDVKIADSFFKRFVGLLAHKKLDNGEALLIKRCNQIHMIGMKFSIDAVFLSKTGEVVHIENDIKPGKISKYIRSACQVLEMESGVAEKFNIKTGDNIIFN
jgi:uncharacterized protein